MSSYLELTEHQLYYGPEEDAIEWLWWRPYDPAFSRQGEMGFHFYWFRCKPCMVEWAIYAHEEEMPNASDCWACNDLVPR